MHHYISTASITAILAILGGCSQNTDDENGSKSYQSKHGSASTYALRDETEVSSKTFYNTFAQSKQTYHFAINDTQLENNYLTELDALSHYLSTHPNQEVHLDGFTCELGSSEYNVALGYKRAQSVAQFLEKRGVNKSQIILVSYGKEKPVDINHNEEAWSLNRRVEAYF